MGLIATSFKVEFGASISDALIKASNIGLEAGNILLGVPKNKDVPVDEKALADLEMTKHNENLLKLEKLDKKIKEMEIETKEAKDDTKLS
jgi:hypothetical protein